MFTILEHYGVITGTPYWSVSLSTPREIPRLTRGNRTATNVSEGLNALVTTAEMVLIALFQLYAFSYTECVSM